MRRTYRGEVIRAFIFDLDGTLVDSLPGIALALNHALTDSGLENFSENEVCGFIGDGMAVLVERALGDQNFQHHEAVLAGFQKHYLDDWKKGTTPYSGMLELLLKLYEKELPLAVLSNKPHDFTVKIVNELFPDHLFNPIQGHREGFPKKPDPTTALQIVSDWNLEPGEVAYVGDSTVDLATAEAAGLVPMIFSWGYGTPEGIPLIGSAEGFFERLGSKDIDTRIV